MNATPSKKSYRPGSWILLPVAIVLAIVIAFIVSYLRSPPDDRMTGAELEANRAKTAAPH